MPKLCTQTGSSSLGFTSLSVLINTTPFAAVHFSIKETLQQNPAKNLTAFARKPRYTSADASATMNKT